MTYRERFLAHLAKQCRVRGIPEPEVESVLAELRKAYPKLDTMEDHELRRVQQGFEQFFRTYLEGAKRRPTVRTPPAGGGSATGSAGVTIG